MTSASRDLSSYRDLYGPQDPSILHSQETHRSELIYSGKIGQDETLRANQLTSNIFWTFRIDDADRVILHPRVLDILYDMGFYHVARCGAMKIDSHLITALVERWRPETHTFHFPIGEATVTLQDVAIIWGLRIDGEPVTIDEHQGTIEYWRFLCASLLGFVPEDGDFKSKTRIKVSAICNHFMNIEITDDTEQEVVEQYARGCVLVMLASFMMPDSSRSHVSLLYLRAIENIALAANYSWGSAVLACLYRELCNASDSEKTTIGGALSLLQIWAWSRIPLIQPTNHDNKLMQGSLEGFNGRNLGLPPYGFRWMSSHSYVHSNRFSVRVYRDIFDRMTERDFHWIVYNMESPEIATLDNRCITQNWMAECPLIMMAIVELHHPNRVLRQFGCVQGLPPVLDHAHSQTHLISFQGRDGYNWRQYHQNWIQFWDIRQPVNAVPIHDNQSLAGGYMGWYRSITRLIISPRRYEADVGYQSTDIASRDEVYQMMRRLNIAANAATTSNTSSVEALRQASYDVVRHSSRLLGRLPLNSEPYITEPSTTRLNPTGPSTAEASCSRPRGRRRSASREPIYSEVPTTNEGYIPQYETPSVYIPQSHTPSVYIPQPMTPADIQQDPYNIHSSSFTHLLQTDYPQVGPQHGGWGHTDIGAPHYTASPIPFTGFDASTSTFGAQLNVEEDQNEEEEQHGVDARRRGVRQRRAPQCGTGSHRRMH